MKASGVFSLPELLRNLILFFYPKDPGNQTFHAKMLVRVSLIVFFGMFGMWAVIVGELLQGGSVITSDAVFIISAQVLFLGMLFLNRSGRSRLAGGLFILVLILIVSVFGFLEGNPPNDPVPIVGLLITVIFAMAVLEKIYAWIALAISSFAYVTLNLLWLAGALPAEIRRNQFYDAMMMIFIWFVCVIIIFVVFQTLLKGFRDQSEMLEKKVNERTKALNEVTEETRTLNRAMLNMLEDLESSNAALTQQKDTLASVNRELASFSYSVSHDLRAPLRAIEGFSRILAEDFSEGLSPEVDHYLQLIRKNSTQMRELIDDLLAFSRSSRVEVRRSLTAPAALVEGVREELLDNQNKDQIQFIVSDLPVCYADPVLLRQVYQNLLDNALKYTSGRPVAMIEVGFSPVVGSELSVYYVKDNGIGFDMKYADKIFDVFQRLHADEKFEGTGIGLAIVSRIITRHGGKIWAESAPDRGATFYFTLGLESTPGYSGNTD